MLNEVYQEGETRPGMPEDHDWSFDLVRVKYANLNSIKSVLFTKLESGTHQRWTEITYKINSRWDGNLNLIKILKCLFP